MQINEIRMKGKKYVHSKIIREETRSKNMK